MADVSATEDIEREIRDSYARLAESAAVARYCHEHYLDGLLGGASPGRATGDLFTKVTDLAAAHPWALASFADPAWDRYEPDQGAAPPDGLRVGALKVADGNGLPPMPAVARLAGYGHLLIAEDENPEAARALLQALGLRLATATTPGSIRFALADPAGQGRHLSAFLRLPAPLLRVGSGVAASESDIEALLRMLTAHVVEVTQNRLTNVFESVEAYNAATTGVAVPYHVLMLAGFPVSFTDRSAQLLITLAQNGPRAGMYIVATMDPRRDMPRDFDVSSLTALATNLRPGSAGTFSWDDPDFRDSVVEPDQMPPASRANPWLDAVAAVAGSASLDLPFERIAVPPESRWVGDSTDGLDVQVGADSKGEPQHFRMGGASGVHHGLVGGNTRMGKTNLLHVLINQLALRYPPEELELYLLDFRQVEFDAYLTQRLPHARAISSRTDREFGLSMLRKFHDEIGRREHLGLATNTTSLLEYRHETGKPLPRALVIMDEFQVMFADEDRLAREAARLLADIAKRGAAYGLHLLLATQSPGGALLTLLRPVYEQMTLRIALGCTTPSVSYAILGEGNDSATKLTRPGDAIYNDHSGEGANPVIRIAALPTRDRREWIATISALTGGKEYPAPDTFDPGAAAKFSSHPAAVAFAASPGQWPAPGPTVDAWLGEAIEIKPPTTATFERYVRSNLLIVGEEENSHGLLLATLLSAAIQRSPADLSFTIIEFARPSSPFHGFFASLQDLPHDVQVCGPRAAEATLDALISDLDQRLADASDSGQPEQLLVVAGLHQWQEVLAEVNYRPSEVSARLTRLAEQGPDVGIHVVAWADSYATAERAFRRAGVGHFGLRAVLRVSTTTESDALLSVPAAASLDDNRALYRDTDWPHEQVEKFKPYSITPMRAFAQAVFRSPA